MNIKNAFGHYPSWLTPDELEQAEALIELDFCFCGDRFNYCVFEDNSFGRAGSWKFSAYPCANSLDVVIKNALFSKCLDHLDGDWDKFNQEVKQAKNALKAVIRKQNSRVKQLSLWEGCNG